MWAQQRHTPLTMPRQRIVQSYGAALVTKHATTPFSLSTVVGLTSIGRIQSGTSRILLGFWMPFSVITDIDEGADVVTGARIWSWPNPFRDNVGIEVAIPYIETIHADIYNNHGSRIGVVVPARVDPDGAFLTWNGIDLNGNPVANGLYTVRLTIRQFVKRSTTILSATILCNR